MGKTSAFAGALRASVAALCLGAALFADSVEDVQTNAFRRAVSLNGEWEVSEPHRSDEHLALDEDPYVEAGWLQGAEMANTATVRAPVNQFFVWQDWKPTLWEENLPTLSSPG